MQYIHPQRFPLGIDERLEGETSRFGFLWEVLLGYHESAVAFSANLRVDCRSLSGLMSVARLAMTSNSSTPQKFKLPTFGSRALVVSSLFTLISGVASVTLKPIVSKPWADFFVGFGIALLVYAAVAITLWLISGPITASDEQRARKGEDSGDGDQDSDKQDEENFAQAQNFVLRIFAILRWLGVVGIVLLASGMSAPLP